MASLPLASYGLAWLPVFFAGLVLGLVLYVITGRKPGREELEETAPQDA